MKQLSDAGRDFLRAPRFAVLATINADGTPQQSVVWYDLRGDVVMMNTARGRLKDRNMRRDPRVSLCVEEGLQFVTVSGKVEIVGDAEVAQRDIHDLAVRYNGADSAKQQMDSQYAHEERVTLHLRIEKVVERL